MIPKDTVLLRIFIGEDDKHGRQPLYEAIVIKAREAATVLRGPMEFGHSSRLHTAKILRFSENLPVVIDDRAQRGEDQRLPAHPRRDDDERSTIEKVQALQYGQGAIEKPMWPK